MSRERRATQARDLDLSAVNDWRALNGLGPVDPSQIDSSRINVVDFRASKTIDVGAGARFDVVVQVFNLFNTVNLQSQYGGGRVTNSLSSIFGSIQTARPGTQGELAVKVSW